MRFNGQSSRITSLKHQMDSKVDYLTKQEDFSNLQHKLLNLNHQSHWQKFQQLLRNVKLKLSQKLLLQRKISWNFHKNLKMNQDPKKVHHR